MWTIIESNLGILVLHFPPSDPRWLASSLPSSAATALRRTTSHPSLAPFMALGSPNLISGRRSMGGMSYKSPAREPTAIVASWTIQISMTRRSGEFLKHGLAKLRFEKVI
jgi:hypothetical protein